MAKAWVAVVVCWMASCMSRPRRSIRAHSAWVTAELRGSPYRGNSAATATAATSATSWIRLSTALPPREFN